jgi:phenylacetate-CoA ligase
MTSIVADLAGAITGVATLLQCSRRLNRDQWLPAGVLADRRRARFRQLLRRAASAPYYRATLHDAGLLDFDNIELHDLERLPFLDREVLATRGLDDFLTVGRSKLFSVTTSGSTGTPGRFLRSRPEEADFSARWWRVYAAFGCSLFDAQVNVAGPVKPDRQGPIALLRKTGLLPRIGRLCSNEPPERVLSKVLELNPPILTGYAGAIEALAEHVLATGARIQPPRAVFCTAMEVTEHCLIVAEQAFHAPAVDVYVTNEFGVIAWSCPKRRDLLHVNDDTFVVEIVSPDGTPLPPGSTGELVVTSFGLNSMPLIRYRMGDLAARVAEPCACGRGLGLVGRIQGRTAHSIRRSDGGLITTPIITNLFGRARAYEWVRQFQVREERGGILRVLLNIRNTPTDTQRNTLTSMLHSGVGADFQISLETVNQIPLAPSGKLQFLVPLRAPSQPPRA